MLTSAEPSKILKSTQEVSEECAWPVFKTQSITPDLAFAGRSFPFSDSVGGKP